ncbi:MAG: hypothetical protein GWP14_00505 [Actinobacteria bacterium]|nr:hypothetical protein [Actinomycetota bacterium]
MLTLIASGTHLALAIGGVLGAVPVPGQYFSFTKIVLALVLFGVLARIMTWTDADLDRLHGPRTLWNTIMLAVGLIAVSILLFIPNFLVAVLLFLAVTSTGLGSYVLWRNSLVAEVDRVFTATHLRKVLTGSAGDVSDKTGPMPELDIAIQQTNGAIVTPPQNDELLQTGFQLTHFLLADALTQRATDVALIPTGQATKLLYRIDGVTTERQRLTLQDSSALAGFMKYAAKLDVQEKRVPQRGRLAVKSGAGLTPLWISTSGSSAGERLDIKLLRKAQELGLNDLRLPAEDLKRVQALAQEEKGQVVVTGGRDCGTTTTLYAFLRSHDAYVQHIHSIETRPLAELENVTQHKPKIVDGKINIADTLRTVLRGDPGVVLVEPVKEATTLKMMLKAAQGDRKVYAGMSCSSTFAALAEIMTLAGAPELVAESLKGIVAQKLLRRLCPSCREAYPPDAQLLKRLNLPVDKIKQFYRPPSKPLVNEKGKPIICSTCGGTGYFGRVGAFEILMITDEIRDLIRQDAGISQIRSACRKKRMLYLQEQALRRVIEGLTSISEVVHISKT